VHESSPLIDWALAGCLGVAIALGLGAWIGLRGRRFFQRRRLAIRMRDARLGEHRARRILEAHGFRVMGEQVSASHLVCVDGQPASHVVRADYIAQRDGAWFVAEIKTGSAAPRIETPATRRQILEYRVVFDVDGVVLVNAEAGTLHEIEFPHLSQIGRSHDDNARGVCGLHVVVRSLMFFVVVALAFGLGWLARGVR